MGPPWMDASVGLILSRAFLTIQLMTPSWFGNWQPSMCCGIQVASTRGPHRRLSTFKFQGM
eukprot:6458210-Amphidinium_carterae.2